VSSREEHPAARGTGSTISGVPAGIAALCLGVPMAFRGANFTPREA